MTFVKAKFKKSDELTNFDKYWVAEHYRAKILFITSLKGWKTEHQKKTYIFNSPNNIIPLIHINK